MENAGATTRENGEQRGVVGGNNGNFAGVALARPCPQSAPTPGERAKKSQPIRVGILVLVVEKVIVSPNDLEVRLRANGIERLVLELRPEPVEQQVEALA